MEPREEIRICKTVNDVKQNRGISRFIKIAALCIGIWFVFLQAPMVEAHSTLLEVTPTERVVTDVSPSVLKLRFNEPIEQELANVTIYDWNAKPVFVGHPNGESERSPVLVFSLPKLKHGTYTVRWSIVSLDGHPVSGSYSFAVGKATAGQVKSVTGTGESGASLIAIRAIVQGLLILGAGLYVFAWSAEKRHYPGIDKLLRRSRYIVFPILIAGTFAELITYALALPTGLVQTVLKGRWDLLLQFPFVLMLLAQLLILLLLLIPGMVRGWYVVMWFVLATIPAFGGHVWGMEHPVVALIPRVIHQVAIALWLGALIYIILLHILKKKEGKDIFWESFRPFFVNRMMVVSGLVLLSGMVMVYLQTGWIAIFTDWMDWSTLLFSKILLTIFMLSMALYQTFKWKKQKEFSTIRVVRVEWLAGLAVVFIGVWMSQSAYPIPIKSYNDILTSDQVQAKIHIANLQAGEQKMVADISPFDGVKPKRVSVVISMPDHGMKSGPFTMQPGDSGNYQAQLPFSMSGTWRLLIHAEYPNGEKIEWTDDVFIAGAGNG